MTTELQLTVTVTIAGAAADAVRDDLLIDADAGELDQAMLNLLRDHLKRMGDFRDYRILQASVDLPEVAG